MPEPALNPSDADFHAFFIHAPAACLVLNPDLRIVAVSDQYLQATLTQREQILGRGIFDVFPDDPDDPAADGARNLRASLNRVIVRREPDTMVVQRYPIRREDGSFEERFWQPSNHPVLGPEGGLRFIIHHVVDVTRQTVTERSLQSLTLAPGSALAAYFDGMFEGVQVIDMEARYAYINATAAAQGRRSPQALTGQRMVDAFPGIDQSEFYPYLIECLRLRRPYSMRNHFNNPDGSDGWFDLRIEPVPGGALILSFDISDQVKLEETMRASGRLEAVGRLAGGIAHDFNNLITVIAGYAELVDESLGADSPHHEALGSIRTAGARAADLTRQLLAFSRKQVLQPQILDLNRVLMDVGRMLERVIGEDIRLVLKPQPGLGSVSVDPGQLEQIVMNLALNARDAMPQGGQLTLETADVVLDELYVAQHDDAQMGPHVMLAVSDSGEGMSPEIRRRIFEPFFTTKSVGKGTGLGLSTVHGIVKQSGGNIWVYSEPGQGTCFKVYLPRVEGAKQAPVVAATAEPKRGSGRILLVEDEPGVRHLFEAVLRSGGFDVLSAGSGEEALHVQAGFAEGIDLLLTDVVLPGMGGRQLADAMQAQRPGIKVVFMSGYTENAIVHKGVLDSGIAFIGKPVAPTELLRRIRIHMGEAEG